MKNKQCRDKIHSRPALDAVEATKYNKSSLLRQIQQIEPPSSLLARSVRTTSKVPTTQIIAHRIFIYTIAQLLPIQAVAGGLLAGSLAAGAAGLLTVRLALSAAGLSVAWGFCQAPHWGRGRGTEVMDG